MPAIPWKRQRTPRKVRWWELTRVWVFAYPLMILIFALVYLFQSFSFYQTTATQEPSYASDGSVVEKAIAAGVQKIVAQQAKANKCKQCLGLPAPVPLSISATSTDILITLGFPAATDTGEVSAQVDVPEESISSSYVNEALPYFLVSTSSETSGLAYSASLQLFQQFSEGTLSPTMPMTPEQTDSIQELAYAAQGLVGGLSDQFPRMLYFSAVSATTLGFGDIVPVTTGSRLFVTSEALLGVVIVGLFLNSLARRSAGGKRSRVGEIDKLVSLRDSGALTPDEFDQLKATVIAER